MKPPSLLCLLILGMVLVPAALAAQDSDLSPEALYSRGLAKTIPPNVNFAEAASLFRQAADRGSVRAQRSLGEMYLSGQGVNKDVAEGVRWLRKAADKGDAKAQSDLGSLYVSGMDGSVDEKESIRWFKKAAEQGDVAAQLSLGAIYRSKDGAESLKWFRKAAEQGSDVGQLALGSIYEGKLKGVTVNLQEAVTWYTKALQQGVEAARKPLDAIRNLKVISPDEAAANLLNPMNPIVPPLAKAARTSADVVLEVTVNAVGEVKSHKMIRGHPLLNDAAIESVLPLRYKPYLVNGDPVWFVTRITVSYVF